MGYGFPAAIGAQFAAPKELVVAIVGDGGFQMTLYELATVFVNKLPVKVLIVDNKYLGSQSRLPIFNNKEIKNG